MMHKIFMVAGIVGAVIVAMLLAEVAAFPLIRESASSANTTISASSNMTNYPGLSGALIGSPLWLYFVIPVIGIVLIVITLREPIANEINRRLRG